MSESSLVIVSGPPCSGKTTIGRAITRESRLPFFSKDDIKELLFDQVGWSDRAWSIKLGISSILLLHDITAKMLAAGASAVIESAFHKDLATPIFIELKKSYGCTLLQVHFQTSSSVVMERFQKRANGTERHPGHGQVDATQIEELRRKLESGTWDMQIPGAQLITVDTNKWEDVDIERICSDVNQLLREAALNTT